MLILAIDCAAALCAACVWDAGAQEERGRAVLDLGKGHAEHLIGILERALAEAGLDFGDIGAVAVSVGPGSFTGIRVGVSAARGLALALKIPAVGVTTLEAVAAETRARLGQVAVLVAFSAGPDTVQAALYDETGAERMAPAVISVHEACAILRESGAAAAGTAARALAGEGAAVLGPQAATADVAFYARLAAGRTAGAPKPRPLYLRAPDARPQAGFVLPRRSG